MIAIAGSRINDNININCPLKVNNIMYPDYMYFPDIEDGDNKEEDIYMVRLWEWKISLSAEKPFAILIRHKRRG